MDQSRFREAIRAGCVDPWAASVLWGKGSSPPQAPDYTGAAIATAAGNQDAARTAVKGNRVSQYTPYGNIVYTPGVGGDQDQWRSDISLSPTGQQLLNYSDQASLGLGQQTGQALNRVDSTLSQPFDQSSVGDIYDTAYATQTGRLDPQWQQRQQQQETQLRNQGLVPGGEAYDNAMRDFNYARNDAYSQARQNAIATMPQTYQLATSARNQPLNELNALRTGSQVQNPTFQTVPQQQTVAGPDLLGAAKGGYDANLNAYNAQVGQSNSMTNGLMSLAGGAMMFLSDGRLKSNVVRVGTHPLGVGVYEYDIFDRRERGVMADEVEQVMPAAVMRGADGYLRVNYGMLGSL